MTDKRRPPRPGMAAAAASRVDGQATAGQTAARSKPVRMTVEVPPELHRELSSWTHAVMLDVGSTRVTISDAVRAMIKLTMTDTDVAAKVRALLPR